MFFNVKHLNIEYLRLINSDFQDVAYGTTHITCEFGFNSSENKANK